MNKEESLTCDNCKLKIASQNYVMHTLHCARHLELCKKCGEPVPKGKLEEHISAEHADEVCNVCGKSMEKGLLLKHEQSDCPKRLISCLYCELELPSNEMTAHTDYCGTRTEKCTECGEFVMLKYTQLHLDSNHKFLKLEDEPGPSASWEESAAAVTNVKKPSLEHGESTLLPCEFCDGMFTPRELRRHQVSCTHGWGTTIPVLRRISVIECKLCGKSIASREYEAHSILCAQPNLPSRSDRSNTLNTSVIPCDVCDSPVPFEEYGTHSNRCSKYPFTTVSNNKQPLSRRRRNSVIPCDVCNQSIPLDEYQKHRILCVQPVMRTSSSIDHLYSVSDSALKLPCEFCEESFSPERLAAHQICCSPTSRQTAIPCELCGELKSLAEVLEHQLRCNVSGDV